MGIVDAGTTPSEEHKVGPWLTQPPIAACWDGSGVVRSCSDAIPDQGKQSLGGLAGIKCWGLSVHLACTTVWKGPWSLISDGPVALRRGTSKPGVLESSVVV